MSKNFEKTLDEMVTVYMMALLHYGIDNQLFQAVEEMAELTKELSKFRRGEPNRAAVVEELVDVEIMHTQMMLLFDINGDEYTKLMEQKIDRLKKRIEDAQRAEHMDSNRQKYS